MSLMEVLAGIGGLVIGYWFISRFVSAPEADALEVPDLDDAMVDGEASRHWSEVLGVPVSAGEGEITAAYRRAIALHHPDRVAAMAPEIQALAVRRTTQINAAYDQAMQDLGTSAR